MDDGLRERIKEQVRERAVRSDANYEARAVEIMAERAPEYERDDVRRTIREMQTRELEKSIANTLPFALEIAERDGVTDRLSEEQLDEAGVRASQRGMEQVVRDFEARLSKVSPERRQFAEAFLAMSQSHVAMMGNKFADPRTASVGDLEQVSQNIADDLRKLTTRLYGRGDATDDAS